MQRIFGKQLSPEDMVKKWRQNIKSQERQMDRQLRSIEAEEVKVKRSLKEMAKKNADRRSMKSLAMELYRSNKQKERIHTSKAQLNSVQMQLQLQLSQLKVVGSLKKSTDIMKIMGSLSKMKDMNLVMGEMSREMMKAGLIEEMIGDTLDNALDDDEIEGEADEEVDKILMEVTSGVLGVGGQVSDKLPVAGEEVAVDGSTLLEDDGEMEARLEALKS
ncbi:hypothetical protein MIR68_009166 [Amoeboaphelidium protococcarum]|nr:hypothetical protein MIR68_009166 [Amoeboaphelidium protococcarum]